MNPLVVQIANGNAFFIGMGMTVIAFLLRLAWNNRFAVVLLMLAWLLGIGLVVLSAAPLSFWLYGMWFGLCIATRMALNIQSRKTKLFTTGAFAVFSLLLCLVELPFHFASTIPISKRQTIYVVGDSISAGLGEKEKTWPEVLGDLSDLKVINLARAAATLETAMDQANKIPATNALVLAEIGGNDLLGHTDSHAFYRQLDNLLAKLKSRNNQIVMFELPLLPSWNLFGMDQRALAKKYGVTLIPKRYLVAVFAGKGDTVDGLHLSQRGHNELAMSVYKLLSE